MNRDELKARLMAEAEAAIDKILAEKPAGEDITLRGDLSILMRVRATLNKTKRT